MLPAETYAAIGSYYELKNFEFQAEWERARWVGTCAYNSGWGKKNKSPKELLPFPWENDSVTSPQEIENLRKEMGWQLPQEHQ